MFIDRKSWFVNMSVLPNLMYKFKTIPIKVAASYLVDIEKPVLKFMWRGKRPRRANIILKEKNKVGWLTLPDFKTYCKATVLKVCGIDEWIDK